MPKVVTVTDSGGVAARAGEAEGVSISGDRVSVLETDGEMMTPT